MAGEDAHLQDLCQTTQPGVVAREPSEKAERWEVTVPIAPQSPATAAILPSKHFKMQSRESQILWRVSGQVSESGCW